MTLMRKVPRDIFLRYEDLVHQRIYTHPSSLVRWLFWNRLDSLLSMVRRATFARVLDCGCGEGAFVPALSDRFRLVCAVDLDVRGVKRLVRELRLTNVHVAKSDIYQLPYADGSFDLVIAADVLEHLGDLSNALGEIHRVLAPRGTLLVSLPTENAFYQIGRWVFGFHKPHDHYHKPRLIESQLQEKFRIIRRRRFPVDLTDGVAAFILLQAAAVPANEG